MRNSNGDTVSLKEFVLEKFNAIEKSIDQAHKVMEKRLEGMNEFRASLRDQNNTFMTRAEIEAITNKLEREIKILNESKAELAGKAEQKSVNIALAIAVIGLIVSAMVFFVSK